jgi:hypothetical protein
VDIVAHIHILSEGTVRADDSSTLDMTEMPNFRSGADMDAVIHVAALVTKKSRTVLSSPFLIYPIIAEDKNPGYDG